MQRLRRSHKVRKSDEVTQGQIGTEMSHKVRQEMTRLSKGQAMPDKITQVQTRSDEVTQGQIGTKKVTQGQTGTENIIQGQSRCDEVTSGSNND